MKKFILLLLCFTMVSCFVEPKKENPSIAPEVVSTNDTYDNEKFKEPIVDTSEVNNSSLGDIEVQDNSTLNRLSKKDIVDELNLIAKNNSFPSIENKLSFLNEKIGLMLFTSYEFKLDDVYAVYINKDYNDGFGAFHIAIECQKRSTGSNCMYDTGRAEYISASIFPLQNKDACIKYAELFNSLH